MKALNQLVSAYTRHLRRGEIQIAYKGILEFIGKLRADLVKKYPDCNIGGVYQGYMDMSYFSFGTKPLKDKGLKIAVVYLHEKGHFEAWLCARNRGIAKEYEAAFCGHTFDEIAVFHDNTNPDAILEYTLTPAPDFENPAMLTDTIAQGVQKFLATVNSLLVS